MPDNQGTPWILATEFILMTAALLAPWATPAWRAAEPALTASPTPAQRTAPMPAQQLSARPSTADAQAAVHPGDRVMPVARTATPPPSMHPLQAAQPPRWPSATGRLSDLPGLRS